MQYSCLSDTELFTTLRRPPREAERAFAELYARYAQKIFLYCRKVMGNETEANDIFQEVWMKFHMAAGQEAIITNVGGYLLKIARNLCLNRRRNAKTFLTLEDFQFIHHDSPYEQKELLTLIDRALDLLEVEYRESFVLHELEGLPYDEIAAITGDTIPALKNRVWRARKQIREILSPFLTEINE